MARLTPEAFVTGEIGKPFRWGRTDCGTTAARWAAERGGVCPFAALGVSFRSGAGVADLFARYGGMMEFGNAALRAAGWAPTTLARPGDIGVVRARVGRRTVSCFAILTRSGWAAHLPSGVTVQRAPAVAAWTMEDGACPE